MQLKSFYFFRKNKLVRISLIAFIQVMTLNINFKKIKTVLAASKV